MLKKYQNYHNKEHHKTQCIFWINFRKNPGGGTLLLNA